VPLQLILWPFWATYDGWRQNWPPWDMVAQTWRGNR